MAIDDFGTGYSSRAHLRQFPVDILKIDRMFVEALADSYESTVLVRPGHPGSIHQPTGR